jgi:potassium large conductance calcium-activated channel subfamily M alpha member 1
MTVGIADDQAKDFDFEKTEMKYDSTGMFHWSPAKNLEDCILASFLYKKSNFF